MKQTQQQSFSSSIPTAVKAVFEPIPPRFPDDELLRNFQGEVLIVQTGAVSNVFDLNQAILPVFEAKRFISAAQYRNASYLVGSMTPAGGRFRSITRNEAIGKIGKWIFEVI